MHVVLCVEVGDEEVGSWGRRFLVRGLCRPLVCTLPLVPPTYPPTYPCTNPQPYPHTNWQVPGACAPK